MVRPGSGGEEGLGDADRTFAAQVFADRGVAGAGDHEVGGEARRFDVAEAQKGVELAATVVVGGEHQARAADVVGVEEAVRGEMDVAVRGQETTEDGFAAGGGAKEA